MPNEETNQTHRVLTDFKKWRLSNDEDYCYDEIHEFFAVQTRGDLLSFMYWCVNQIEQQNNK